MTDATAQALAYTALMRPAAPFSSADLETLSSYIKSADLRPNGAGGAPFTLEGYHYARPLYEERRDKIIPRIVVMKAARTGMTTWLLARNLWFMSNPRLQFNTALLFPNLRDVLELHTTRLRPMIRGSSKVSGLVGDVDRVELLRVGVSNARFRGMNSGAGLDSFDTDSLSLDEVRLMALASIERAFIRTTKSRLILPDNAGNFAPGIHSLNSTAGFPDSDIDYYFQQSTQNYWATPCPNPACKNHRAGIIMPLRFPDCVGRDGKRLYYQCPDCLEEIPDEVMTKQGWFIERNPGAGWVGYQFSQILLGSIMLNEIWAAWNRGHNLSEVYNSRLGLPYRDPNAVPAPKEVTMLCRDNDQGLRWVREGEVNYEWVSAGLDQRAPEKHLVIYGLGRNNVFELLHLEVIEGDDDLAKERLAELCVLYGVKIAVIDGEPSYDFAVGAARALEKLGMRYGLLIMPKSKTKPLFLRTLGTVKP